MGEYLPALTHSAPENMIAWAGLTGDGLHEVGESVLVEVTNRARCMAKPECTHLAHHTIR